MAIGRVATVWRMRAIYTGYRTSSGERSQRDWRHATDRRNNCRSVAAVLSRLLDIWHNRDIDSKTGSQETAYS